jgi:hypothetical protein
MKRPGGAYYWMSIAIIMIVGVAIYDFTKAKIFAVLIIGISVGRLLRYLDEKIFDTLKAKRTYL